MKKIVLLFLLAGLTCYTNAQQADKGLSKIIKVEPTKIKGVKPNRALLVFKFQGPDGKPVKSHVKVIIDKDTLYPKIDATGTAKVTTKPGNHRFKFMVDYWYSVKLEDAMLYKTETTYTIFVRFEPKEIGAAKSKEKD